MTIRMDGGASGVAARGCGTGSDRAHALWRFASAVYARPGVREACLALQERHGADVNLLLLCGWQAAANAPALESEALAACIAGVERWHRGAVQRLRGIRRRVDAAAAPALRAELLAAELDAEYVEQALLMRVLRERGLLGPLPRGDRRRRAGVAAGCVAVALRNLEAYCGLLGVALEAETRASLRTIARACCGRFPAADE